MKTVCLTCGKSYDHEKNDGLCPFCNAFNSSGNSINISMDEQSAVDGGSVFAGAKNMPKVSPSLEYKSENHSSAKIDGNAIVEKLLNENEKKAKAKRLHFFNKIFPIACFSLAAIIVLLTFLGTYWLKSGFIEKNVFNPQSQTTAKLGEEFNLFDRNTKILDLRQVPINGEHEKLQDFTAVLVDVERTLEYIESSRYESVEAYLKCDTPKGTAFAYSVNPSDSNFAKCDTKIISDYQLILDKNDDAKESLLFFVPKNTTDLTLTISRMEKVKRYGYFDFCKDTITIPLGEISQMEAE